MPVMMPRLIMGLLVLAALSSPAVAQYPNKPITVIVPFAAGGPTDVVTRLVCEHMSRTLGQPIIVENVGGAGGTLGMTRAAQAQPSGYTIAVGNMGTQSAAPALYPNLKYDPAKSFAQVGIVNFTPQAIVVELGSSVPKGADRGPAGLQKLVESEIARITPIIKAAGVTAN
jgi:tripartite-type tricarboxylate transporter receptor subunit TctC